MSGDSLVICYQLPIGLNRCTIHELCVTSKTAKHKIQGWSTCFMLSHNSSKGSLIRESRVAHACFLRSWWSHQHNEMGHKKPQQDHYKGWWRADVMSACMAGTRTTRLRPHLSLAAQPSPGGHQLAIWDQGCKWAPSQSPDNLSHVHAPLLSPITPAPGPQFPLQPAQISFGLPSP